MQIRGLTAGLQCGRLCACRIRKIEQVVSTTEVSWPTYKTPIHVFVKYFSLSPGRLGRNR